MRCFDVVVAEVDADNDAHVQQYAVDAVDKMPYMEPDGSISYNESIVKKLPPTPKRKDKI